MGGAISAWFQKWFGKEKMRLLLLGLDAAGKTNVTHTPSVPTIGFNVEHIDYKNTELVVWDVGGQDKLRPFWRHYYSGTSGIIFVIDCNDTSRIDLAASELHGILLEEELEFSILCVIANKQDMPNAIKPEELSKRLDLDSLNRQYKIFKCIATEGVGVFEALDWLSQNMQPI